MGSTRLEEGLAQVPPMSALGTGRGSSPTAMPLHGRAVPFMPRQGFLITWSILFQEQGSKRRRQVHFLTPLLAFMNYMPETQFPLLLQQLEHVSLEQGSNKCLHFHLCRSLLSRPGSLTFQAMQCLPHWQQ